MAGGPVFLLLAAGCASSPPDLVLEPAHAAAWSGTLDVAETEVAAQTDLTVDWSALTVDVLGQPLGEVADVVLVDTALPRPDFLDELVLGTLTQADVMSQARDLDRLPEDPGSHWFLALVDEEDDLLSAQFVAPRAASTNTEVVLLDGDATLTSTVDLHSAPALQTTAGTAPVLDWSGLAPLDVHEVVVARFDVAATHEVEPLFDRRETEAAELYRLAVSEDATRADLSSAFGGFTTSGVWIVVLERSWGFAPAAVAIVQVH